MYIDLNVPVPAIPLKPGQGHQQSKKGKGKQPQTQPQQSASSNVAFTPAQVAAIENRIDLLVHLGYTVLALNQTVHKKVDAKNHVNVLDVLLSQMRQRAGLVLLKRLTIVLGGESEKGFGLTNQNTSLFNQYDLIALLPTTLATFSLACLSHTTPSPLTAHIIALSLTLPRLPFNLKHTMVRTALKNGAVFEIAYAGALGAEGDLGELGGEGGSGAKRNWWASAREVVRVTKGKGILVSGGVMNDADLRAPRDVGNLITILGLPQNVAHDASTKIPQSLILRAQTRRTYRAVLSEPRIVIPGADPSGAPSQTEIAHSRSSTTTEVAGPPADSEVSGGLSNLELPSIPRPTPTGDQRPQSNGKKRPLEDGKEDGTRSVVPSEAARADDGKDPRERKRKKVKESKA